jgi:hypothetical protein
VGATRVCEIGVTAAASTAGGVEEDLVAGQIHQAITAMTIAAAAAIAITATTVGWRRRDTIALAANEPATASGRNA